MLKDELSLGLVQQKKLGEYRDRFRRYTNARIQEDMIRLAYEPTFFNRLEKMAFLIEASDRILS